MFGMIATIVAIVKRRYKYAVFTGLWTVLALIVGLCGYPEYAVAPGVIFLTIAISMGSTPKEDPTKTAVWAEIEPNDDPEMKFVCMSCGMYSAEWYPSCPICDAFSTIKNLEEAAAASAAEQSSDRAIYFCRSCGYVGNGIAGKAPTCPKCRETLLETGLKQERWRSFSAAEKEAAKENWHNGVLNEISEPLINAEPEPTAVAAEGPKFCRICGKSLHSANHFCPYCGTEILMPENADIPVMEKSMPFNDELPGDKAPINDNDPSNAEKLLEDDTPSRDSIALDVGKAACDTACDSTVPVDGKRFHEEPPFSIKISSANVPPLIRRAFIFIEDSEWERADRYLENALDQEPENAFAYIGKLLVSLKINNISGLCEYKDSLETNCYYKRAIQFADPELKTELQKIVS